jgi:two-component system response regulator WspF
MLDVVWMATDGVAAVAQAQRQPPDLLLMDLLLPRLNGAEATRQIMSRQPCPILVVTPSVRGHIGLVYEAMGHGALDAIDTPAIDAGGDMHGAAALLAKIATIGKLIGKPVGAPETVVLRTGDGPLVLLGASTGGPAALKEVLGGLPAEGNLSVIVVQHVDEAFATGLVAWLAEKSHLPVALVGQGQKPAPNKVLVAGTSDHLVMDRQRRLNYVAEPRDLAFRPSVDVFFKSIAANWPEPGVAVLLTGMGRDGAEGLLRLRQAGWYTIAQDQATSVVWGMPRAAVEFGAAAAVLPVQQIAAAIVEQTRKRTG